MFRVYIEGPTAQSNADFEAERREWLAHNCGRAAKNSQEFVEAILKGGRRRIWEFRRSDVVGSTSYVGQFSRYEDMLHFKMRWS